MDPGVLTVSEDDSFKKPLSGVTYDCLFEPLGEGFRAIVYGKLLPRQLARQAYHVRVKPPGAKEPSHQGRARIVRRQLDLVVFEAP